MSYLPFSEQNVTVQKADNIFRLPLFKIPNERPHLNHLSTIPYAELLKSKIHDNKKLTAQISTLKKEIYGLRKQVQGFTDDYQHLLDLFLDSSSTLSGKKPKQLS